jgi:exodeoxyribonuclease V beta subunit
MKLENLNAADIPLIGKHLIEASAGTGKTYNITRIYLRLLLERELTVDQILLMTFTKDATQELRGRIDSFIRDALSNWQQLCSDDPYFLAISKRIDEDKIQFLLKRALLYLDEASIFTIHGFCQRALSEHAFSSGLSFDAALSTSTADIVLEATQDWYRQLAKQDSETFTLIAQFWPQPTQFLQSFGKAINQRSVITTIDSQQISRDFIILATQAHKCLIDNHSVLIEGLITHKKPDEQEKREKALIELTSWLEQIKNCNDAATLLSVTKISIPDYLLNGNRHPKAYKATLSDILADCKSLKVMLKDLAKNINRANAYKVVQGAIYIIRQQIADKKNQLNMLDFDDLITQLANSLSSENDYNGLAKSLVSQYPVALVDEFQDTDPLQFSILQSLYYSDEAIASDGALYLIGDPKQAIYGFRGGDIFAYLTARHTCDYHWLMDTNYRSSLAMVSAYNQVFTSQDSQDDDAVFGYGIEYLPVKAGKAETKSEDKLASGKALQFIHFEHDEDKIPLSFACPLMATWCANEITTLITEDAVKPEDIAILVRDNREAQFIKKALQTANLACVYLSERANLFHSEQAHQLLKLLKGILSPEHERTYHAALASGLLGFNANAFHQLQQDEIAYQTLKMAFIDFKKQWQQQGFIAMAINLMHQHFSISKANKDRALTNVLHLFEILQATSQKFHQPEELLSWFEQQCNLDSINSELEAELRLESDGNLIRIITQHGAKGLEYPVVFIPFATKHKDPLKFGNQHINFIEYHDKDGKLHLSLGGSDESKLAMANEAYAESIRLLYVAITRAEKRCYLLTTSFEKCHLSPLGKTLQWTADIDITNNLQDFADNLSNSTCLTKVNLNEIESSNIYQAEHITDNGNIEAVKFIGRIERDWWLSSFSALTRNLHHGGVSIPDRDADLGYLISGDSASNAALLRFNLAKGAHSGNLLHDILEHTDFYYQNLHESIKWPLVKYGELAESYTTEDLIEWLQELLKAPLINADRLESDFCLAELPTSKTLRESEFYFPMNQVSMSGLTKLLTDHRNNYSDNMSTAIPVKLPSYQALKGMMHGFIDLIFEQEGKYYVCDYKSSHLGNQFSNYDMASMRMSVESNYYDLQYLIYCLALHRYLQSNIEDYDASIHFGGIYYLYLRGMTNDENYKGCGVYFRNISPEELTKLDRLFAGERMLTQEQN